MHGASPEHPTGSEIPARLLPVTAASATPGSASSAPLSNRARIALLIRLPAVVLFAHTEKGHLALDSLQLALARKRPAEARLRGGLLHRGGGEDAAGIRPACDAAGQVDRAPVPIAPAFERFAVRQPPPRCRESGASLVRRVHQTHCRCQ